MLLTWRQLQPSGWPKQLPCWMQSAGLRILRSPSACSALVAGMRDWCIACGASRPQPNSLPCSSLMCRLDIAWLLSPACTSTTYSGPKQPEALTMEVWPFARPCWMHRQLTSPPLEAAWIAALTWTRPLTTPLRPMPPTSPRPCFFSTPMWTSNSSWAKCSGRGKRVWHNSSTAIAGTGSWPPALPLPRPCCCPSHSQVHERSSLPCRAGGAAWSQLLSSPRCASAWACLMPWRTHGVPAAMGS